MSTSMEERRQAVASDVPTWRRMAPAAAIVVAILLVDAPAYLRRYAWSDDYPVLASATGLGGESLTDHVVRSGRPLLAVIYDVSLNAAGDVTGLRWLRLLGVLGVGLVGVVAVEAMRRAGLSARVALPLAVACCLLPTFQTWAMWATSWPIGWAAIAAGGGGLLLQAQGPDVSIERRTIVAAAAIVASFLVYQPATMFVWFPLVATLVLRERDASRAVRLVVRWAAVVLGSLAAALAVGWLVTSLAGAGIASRAAVLGAADVPSKLAWFVTRPIVIGARPFSVASPPATVAAVTAAPLLAVMVLGQVLRATGSLRRRLQFAAAVFSVLPLALVPNLVIRENQFDFRILAGVAPSMFLLLVVGILVLARRFLSEQRVVVSVTVGLWVLAAVAAVGAVRLDDELFIRPSVATEELFADQLRGFDPAVDDGVAVVLPPDWPRRPRLGIYSTVNHLSHGFVAEPLVQVVLAQRGVSLDRSAVEAVDTAADAPEGWYVVDASPLRDRR